MKKIVLTICILTLFTSLSSCGKDGEKNQKANENTALKASSETPTLSNGISQSKIEATTNENESQQEQTNTTEDTKLAINEKEIYKNDFYKLIQSYNNVSNNDFDLNKMQQGNIRTKFHISNDDIYIEFIEIDNKEISLSIHGSDEVLKECICDFIPSLKNEITKNDVIQAWDNIINNDYEINDIKVSYYSWYGSTRIEMLFNREMII